MSNILEGEMLKYLIQAINSCGVTKNKREFTSLTGTARKKLLKFLPPKLLHCQPSHYAEQVKRLWEVRTKYTGHLKQSHMCIVKLEFC